MLCNSETRVELENSILLGGKSVFLMNEILVFVFVTLQVEVNVLKLKWYCANGRCFLMDFLCSDSNGCF